MINIELGSALVKGKRSLDRQLQEAIVDAIGGKLAVNRDTRRRMNPSFRQIMEGVRDNVESNTPGTTLPTGWKVRTSKKSGELVLRIENVLPYANSPRKSGNGTTTLLEIFEYGTGLHATRGNKAKYPIKARNVSNLIFQFKRGGWFEGPGPVMHPGVEARGMIRKGNDKLQRDTRKALKSLESRFIKNAKSSIAASPGPSLSGSGSVSVSGSGPGSGSSSLPVKTVTP